MVEHERSPSSNGGNTPKHGTSVAISEPYKSPFGGDVRLIRAISSNENIHTPLFFSGGVGVNNLPYIVDAAEHGVEGLSLLWEGGKKYDKTFLTIPEADRHAGSKISRKEAMAALLKPEIAMIVSQHQLDKAKTFLEILQSERYENIDAIFQSTDALNGLLAAHEDPKKFNDIIFAFPGGISRLEHPKESMHTVFDDAFSRIRHPHRVHSENNLKTSLKKSSEDMKRLYRRTKQRSPFVDFASVALSDQGLLLHELRQDPHAPGVSLVIGLEDPIFTPERLIASLRSPEDIDYIMVAHGRHGIGYRKDLMTEIRKLFPMMEVRKTERTNGTPLSPLRDRLLLPSMPPDLAITLRALADKVGK